MAPAKGDGYRPLDLESSSTGQWRTIEEHERLQQEGALPSAPPPEEHTDYYGGQRKQQHVQQSRRNIALIVGGGVLSATAVNLLCRAVSVSVLTRAASNGQKGLIMHDWLPHMHVAGCCFVVLVVVAASVLAPHPTYSAQPSSDSSSTQQSRSSSSGVNERGSRISPQASHAAEAAGSNSSHGAWHEGGVGLTAAQVQERPDGYVPCKGPPLQCAVVNKQPIPEVRPTFLFISPVFFLLKETTPPSSAVAAGKEGGRDGPWCAEAHHAPACSATGCALLLLTLCTSPCRRRTSATSRAEPQRAAAWSPPTTAAAARLGATCCTRAATPPTQPWL